MKERRENLGGKTKHKRIETFMAFEYLPDVS